jgi:mRNA surveillance protein pelota
MKIIAKDDSSYTLKINSKDDFNFLKKVIEIGDTVKGRTYRKIKLSDNDLKSRSVKKSYWLKIKVNKFESGDNFKILGKTIDEFEDIPKNSSQSIDFELNDEITVYKLNWRSYQKDLINESVELANKPRALVCTIDDESSTFANITYSGYTILSKNVLRLSKKRYIEQNESNDIKKISNKLLEFSKYYNSEFIIIGSPLFWKEIIKEKVVELDKDLSKKIYLEDTTSGKEESIREIYRGKVLDSIIQNNKLKRDEDLIDSYFEEISKNNPLFIYSKKEIKSSASEGKIEEIIISEDIINENKDILNEIELFGGHIEIINSKNNSGLKLKGLSGMIAKKRFN